MVPRSAEAVKSWNRVLSVAIWAILKDSAAVLVVDREIAKLHRGQPGQ